MTLFARLVIVSLVLGCAAPALAQGGFVFTPSAPLAPGYAQVIAADFLPGYGRSELFAYDPATGSLLVGENFGAFFSFGSWATVTPTAGWQFVAGDYDGDGASDVLGFYAANGTVWVGINTGASFVFSLWYAAPSGGAANLTAGDFDGDTRADFMADLGGPLLVGINDGEQGFDLSSWATVEPGDGWLFVADGFTPNGVADLGGYHPSNGSLWVGESLGSSFSFTQWGELQSGGWQAARLASGDVNGDGARDLVAYDATQGDVVAALQSGGAFAPVRWAAGVPAFTAFTTGDFAGTSLPDVIGYDAATGALWVGENRPTCNNGLDDDGDGLVDDGEDPGCLLPESALEDPACDDGLDNDGDGFVDMADPHCTQPYRNKETPNSCGIGAELALALAGFRAVRRGRARR